MSVFTPLDKQDVLNFLSHYDVGQLVSYEGIQSGVMNTNYYVDTDQNRFVLTLFEHLPIAELPYFVELTEHLQQKNFPSQKMVQASNGKFLFELKAKPALLSYCLPGQTIENPSVAMCSVGGELIAQLHLALDDFSPERANGCGWGWYRASSHAVQTFLNADEQQLLTEEIALIDTIDWSQMRYGTIHADFFPDNVLIHQDNISGVIDYYFACKDALAYDLAIAVNAWSNDAVTGFDEAKHQALMDGYQAIFPLNGYEQEVFPKLLRLAALRFWLSRLMDYHKQTASDQILVKDPDVKKALMIYHRSRS